MMRAFFLLISFSILLAVILNIDKQNYVFAHINATKIQELIDKKNDIKVLFTYSPEKPIIDMFTKLSFSVQDLEGNHIKDYKAAVIVTNGQRLFKFQNISVADGDFDVEYIFPDDGTHQVITRIDTNSSITPATFSVFVPHQSPPSMLNPFPISPDGKYSLEVMASIILAIVIPTIAIISLIYIIKKR